MGQRDFHLQERMLNFVESEIIHPDSLFITRPAPSHGTNMGGGIEIVVPKSINGLIILSHVTL